MKKGILILLLGIFSNNLSVAQSNNDFQQEMEQLFGELQKSMQHFEMFFNDEMINQLDTFDFKSFGFDLKELERRLEGKDFDNLSIDDMMDIMRIQMEMMEDIDFSQFNELFKNFGLSSPNIPKSDTEKEKGKSKKKRKVYKM